MQCDHIINVKNIDTTMPNAPSREALLDVLAQDPFACEGAARYDVVEFTPSMTAPELAGLL